MRTTFKVPSTGKLRARDAAAIQLNSTHAVPGDYLDVRHDRFGASVGTSTPDALTSRYTPNLPGTLGFLTTALPWISPSSTIFLISNAHLSFWRPRTDRMRQKQVIRKRDREKQKCRRESNAKL
ncbi:hypothetical protein ANO14919_064300 [Xylariales sp. No.14919]|nr:hypothetical protein ANO14919_064300 [Xylariales sp. No.14919]